MKINLLTLGLILLCYCCDAQTKIITTGNNLVDPANPYAADIVIGSDQGTRHDASIMWWSSASASRISNTNDVFYLSTWGTTTPNIAFSAIVGGTSYFQGNVLIGKTSQINPAYKLDINGNVRANSVVVNTTGADFVFEPTYRLYPLSSLEKYIMLNHHLPDIAPAKQMQVEGLDIGENQVKLLQKVEELTLYTISSDKQIKEDETIIRQQQALLMNLQAQLKSQQQETDQLKEQVRLLLKASSKN